MILVMTVCWIRKHPVHDEQLRLNDHLMSRDRQSVSTMTKSKSRAEKDPTVICLVQFAYHLYHAQILQTPFNVLIQMVK